MLPFQSQRTSAQSVSSLIPILDGASPLDGASRLDDRADLRAAALHWLREPDAARKQQGVRGLARELAQAQRGLRIDTVYAMDVGVPGRPAQPILVSPNQLPVRAMKTREGRAAQIHAMAHIEFNAINLALDALVRFSGLPPAYYADWLQVADEEALHFDLLAQHLQHLGFAYGDFPAHNGLWEMAERTRDDVLARMALVPRTLEARGLDASPQVRAKLWQAGDRRAAEILDVILRDEIGHVAIGNRWFGWLCQERGLDPLQAQADLDLRYRAPRMHGPFNLEARRQAGFSERELALLQSAESPREKPIAPTT